MNAARLTLVLLLVVCFALAARLVPTAEFSAARHRDESSLSAMVLGEGRRLFANHLFVKADVYLHAGYYPSIFDGKKLHSTSGAGDTHGRGGDSESRGDFLGQPRDWLDRLGRNFYVTKHTHLGQDDGPGGVGQAGKEREILPWLRMAAALDPHHVETYTVAAYWLWSHLKDFDQAEAVLREGWRENPDSPEILAELGRILAENRKDDLRARNVWEAALRKWEKQAKENRSPEPGMKARLLGELARLEERAGNFPQTIAHLERLKPLSPVPEAIQHQVDELRKKIP